jgi:2-keto-4-pentenoate hydratase/2-oxohepta-3-ene-1,7-dioic acid hydratase in catechol pathway
MKVCTYKVPTKLGVIQRAAILHEEKTLLDINHLWQAHYEDEGFYNIEDRANLLTPAIVSDIIKRNDSPIDKLKETIEIYKKFLKKGIFKTRSGKELSFHIQDHDEIKLGKPLETINCYRDFYIHEKHVAKGFEKRGESIPEAWYEIPAYYKGPTTGFIGQDEDILWPSYSQKLDYELELALVIGRDGINITEKKAKDYIFGYTILNDISARDIQKKEMSVRLGPAKGKDFCSVIGPVIVTADEFKGKDPDLLMQAIINGEQWSEGRSSEGNYSWGQMIEHSSRDEWLLATDLLGSGTVGTGCGLEIDKWIKPGDTIELEVEKIGTLKNTVGSPK